MRSVANSITHVQDLYHVPPSAAVAGVFQGWVRSLVFCTSTRQRCVTRGGRAVVALLGTAAILLMVLQNCKVALQLPS